MKRNQPRFVITGTGRSGTGYAAALFTAAGVKCGHEDYFRTRPGICDPSPSGSDGFRRLLPQVKRLREEARRRKLKIVGDASWLVVPRLAAYDGTVLLQFRHPISVVNSLVGMGFFTDANRHHSHRAYALQYFDLTGDPILDAMRWWLAWNQRAAKYAHFQFALEAWSPALLTFLLESLGVDRPDKRAQEAFSCVKTDVNSSGQRGDSPTRLGWADIPDSETKTLVGRQAEQWGYDPSDTNVAPTPDFR